MKKTRWTKQALERAIKNTYSFRQAIKNLNLVPAGGNYSQIKKYIKKFNLNISHFKGHAWNRDLKITYNPGKPLGEILTVNSDYQSFKLKGRLFNAGLKQKKCEECGWAKTNSEGYLPLELDHINGDSTDNRIENLRILCPNCHSLKPTHRGRNIKKMGEWRSWYTRNT